MLVNAIRDLIEDVCRRGKGPFDMDFFEKHICVMAGIADTLARALGADREVVALSAYLHDITAVEEYTSVAKHHILGGDRAVEILSDYGYPAEKIAAIRQCILTHSAPLALHQGTVEEVCISNADAASQMLMPGYWLHYAFSAKQFGYRQGLDWYLKKIDDHYTGMVPEARAIVEDACHAERLLFGGEVGQVGNVLYKAQEQGFFAQT